jgi:hypothetical protein
MLLPAPLQQPIQPFGSNTKNDGISIDVAAKPESSHLLSNSSAPSQTLQVVVPGSAANQRQHVKQQMLALKNAFSSGLWCAVCWVVGAPCQHPPKDCARFQQLMNDARYREWKISLQFPKFHCFKCCLPQVSTVFID